MPLTLTINSRFVQVHDGAAVLDAINASGAYIIQLCKDPDMKPLGACPAPGRCGAGPEEIFSTSVKLAESAGDFLTNSAYDPNSKIPEYKVCPVRVDAQEAVPAGPSSRRRQRRPAG